MQKLNRAVLVEYLKDWSSGSKLDLVEQPKRLFAIHGRTWLAPKNQVIIVVIIIIIIIITTSLILLVIKAYI